MLCGRLGMRMLLLRVQAGVLLGRIDEAQAIATMLS